MITLNIISFMLYISASLGRTPDNVYCANKECSEPISKAKTLINYNSPDLELLSFRGNAEAIIFMKSAGSNTDLWYASINGKSGFVNKKFLREYKIIEKNPQFVLPIEEVQRENKVQPDKVQKPHEVFEGTTIYTTEAAVQDSTTEIPNKSILIENVTSTLENKKSFEESSNENKSENLSSQMVIDPKNSNTQEALSEINEQEPGGKDQIKDDPQTNKQQSDNKKSNIDLDLLKKDQHQQVENPELKNSENDDTDSAEEQNNIHGDVNSQSLDATSISNMEQKSVEVQPTVSNIIIDKLSDLLLNKNEEVDNKMPLDIPTNEEFNINDRNTDKDNVELLIKNESVEISKPDVFDSMENKMDTHQNLESSDEELTQVNSNTTSDSVNNGTIQSEETSTETIQNDIHSTEANQEPVNDDYENDDEESDNTADNNPENLVTVTQLPLASDISPINDQAHNIITNPTENENQPISTQTLQPIFNPDIGTLPPNFIQSADTISPPTPSPYMSPTEQSAIADETKQEYESDDNEIIDSNENTMYDEEISINDPYPAATETLPKEEFYNPTTESSPLEAVTNSYEDPTTQSVDDSTDGIFSSMYTTISEMWTTESPEKLFNNREYSPVEKEKVDGEEGFSVLKYIISTYASVTGSSEQTKAFFQSSGDTCIDGMYHDGFGSEQQTRLLTFLLTSAMSVLLFTLGYYYIDNKRQDGRLIGTINSLQRDLLFATKECEILKEELTSTKNKLAGIEDNSFGMDDMVQSLKEEIKEMTAQNERLRNSLDDNEKLLRVSENTAGELQNTLGEVENTLSELLTERANSEEQIAELNEKVQAFEEELISVSRERDNFQLKYVSAESTLEELRKQVKQLDEINKQLTEAKNKIELQRHEIIALKEAIKELKSDPSSNGDAASLIDLTEIKAKLSKVLEEKNKYVNKYEIEHKERTRLSEELETTQETLRTSSQQATEATTRLEVLGKYFQERESELLKELSAKESLWLSKQGESASTVEKIELLQQEVQRYKEKCDALTLELAEAESARRTAMGEVERRAHAAWLEARAARRDADAARDDAATLRRKLASLTLAADGAVSPHHKVSSPLEGGENPVVPPPLPPLPPLAFLPPPLLPPLPRPPPLGRLPSPHPPRYNDRRYSPESRYSPGSRYSPESRYSPSTVRYSPDSRYSPRPRRSPYSPRSRRRSRERYEEGRGSQSRNIPDTETEYPSDSPSRDPRRRNRYSRHSGPSSASGCSSESDK